MGDWWLSQKKVGPPLGKRAFPTKYPIDKPTQQNGGGGIGVSLNSYDICMLFGPANYPRRHAFVFATFYPIIPGTILYSSPPFLPFGLFFFPKIGSVKKWGKKNTQKRNMECVEGFRWHLSMVLSWCSFSPPNFFPCPTSPAPKFPASRFAPPVRTLINHGVQRQSFWFKARSKNKKL